MTPNRVVFSRSGRPVVTESRQREVDNEMASQDVTIAF